MRASYRGPRLREMEEFPEQVICKPWAPKDEQDWTGEQWKNGPGREKSIYEDWLRGRNIVLVALHRGPQRTSVQTDSIHSFVLVFFPLYLNFTVRASSKGNQPQVKAYIMLNSSKLETGWIEKKAPEMRCRQC